MRLNKTIFWTTILSTILSLLVFLVSFLFIKCEEIREVVSDITLAIFGSSLLVCIPALITFKKQKNETEKRILQEIMVAQKLIEKVYQKTIILRGINRDYDVSVADKENQTKIVEKIMFLYNALKSVESFDFYVLNSYVQDYVYLGCDRNTVRILCERIESIFNQLKISSYPEIYGKTVLYETGQYTTEELLESVVKPLMEKIEPIEDKIRSMEAIYILLKMKFYKEYVHEITTTVSETDFESILNKIEWLGTDKVLCQDCFRIKILTNLQNKRRRE